MNYEPIAIVGYGVIYPPNSFSNKTFWENIVQGVSGIREVTDKVWSKADYYSIDRDEEDKTYCKNSGYLDSLPQLDAFLKKHRINIKPEQTLNRSQHLVLHSIFQALENGQLTIQDIRNSGLVIGNMLGDLDICDYILDSYAEIYLDDLEKLSIIKDRVLLEETKQRFLAEMKNKFTAKHAEKKQLVANNLSEKIASILALEQASMIIDGACSGSLVAVDEAIKLLHAGKMSTCIVSGVLGNMGVTGNVAFSKIGGLSESFSKPLDKNTTGLTPGEGAGTIIIKKLKDAINEGNMIYGVIRGSGVASDGGGQSIYAPSTSGQYLAMKKSLTRAGLTIQDIDYIEMHATGTPVGDKVELNSIIELCKEEPSFIAPLWIGSIKSQIGHSFSGAGIANLVKVLLGMQQAELPPTYNFTEFSADMQAANAYLAVNTKLRAWGKNPQRPRRAMVNAFGFGGINGNLLVEEFDKDYHEKLISEQKDAELYTGGYAIVGAGLIDDEYGSLQNWKDDERLKEQPVFPFMKFKIPPKILNKIDKAQQISLIAASEAIAELSEPMDKVKTGVYVGSMMGLKNSFLSDVRVRTVEYTSVLKQILGDALPATAYRRLEDQFKKHFETIEEDSLPGFMDNIVASRISNHFDLHGCNVVFDSGCSSFSTALSQGILSLKTYENNLVLVGGVHANDIAAYKEIFMQACGMPGQDWDQLRNGACFFVVKRLDDVKESDIVYSKFTDPQFCRQKISYNESRKNYFGADDAFQLLEIVHQLQTTENEVAMKKANSLATNGYALALYSENARLPTQKFYQIAYLQAADLSVDRLSELLENPVTLTAYLVGQTDTSSEKAAAIVYDSDQDLRQKLELLKKAMVQHEITH